MLSGDAVRPISEELHCNSTPGGAETSGAILQFSFCHVAVPVTKEFDADVAVVLFVET
jgi:hypothetical protein